MVHGRPRRAMENWVEVRGGIIVHVLDNVRSRLLWAERGATGWTTTEIAGLPANASLSVQPFGGEDDPDLGTDVLVNASTFEAPTTISLMNGHAAPAILKIAPNTFDASSIEVQQGHARADDGENIPYFLVGKNLSAGGRPRP